MLVQKYWKKKTQDEINKIVFDALRQNINYDESYAFGLPASHLDSKVFSQDESFIKDAPFISTLVKNPNHIGCHTLGKSESYFKGTQAIERDLIEICAVDILKGEADSQDGYVASGGTEANLQAIWVYRNYFVKEYGAEASEIALVCSTDSHYCVDKAANVFAIDLIKVAVDEQSRIADKTSILEAVEEAEAEGKKYFIVFCNMMTTMFGSIDKIDSYVEVMESKGLPYKIHVDGAFGGFYFPFTEDQLEYTFANPHISSFTLDAHKMAQAPYGTGIFLIRKGLIKYANTEEASYVEGEDCTLIGSRSGANVIAVWMILVKNGYFGWKEKIFILQKRTEWICEQLDQLRVDYYRHPLSNIITIKSEFVPQDLAIKYGLVPDKHTDPNWYKIVVMEHVTIEKALELIEELSN